MRYRDNAGSTFRSLTAAKHVARLGNLEYVRGYVYQGKYGTRVGVLVRGSNGTARFDAYSWGYNGTGPNGLKRFLAMIAVPEQVADNIAFNTPWETDKIGEKWRYQFQAA